jgi:hypothetical protein
MAAIPIPEDTSIAWEGEIIFGSHEFHGLAQRNDKIPVTSRDRAVISVLFTPSAMGAVKNACVVISSTFQRTAASTGK